MREAMDLHANPEFESVGFVRRADGYVRKLDAGKIEHRIVYQRTVHPSLDPPRALVAGVVASVTSPLWKRSCSTLEQRTGQATHPAVFVDLRSVVATGRLGLGKAYDLESVPAVVRDVTEKASHLLLPLLDSASSFDDLLDAVAAQSSPLVTYPGTQEVRRLLILGLLSRGRCEEAEEVLRSPLKRPGAAGFGPDSGYDETESFARILRCVPQLVPGKS